MSLPRPYRSIMHNPCHLDINQKNGQKEESSVIARAISLNSRTPLELHLHVIQDDQLHLDSVDGFYKLGVKYI